MLDHDVFYGTCDAYELLMLIVRFKRIGCMQLINYCFIIQIDGYMYSFGWADNFMLIMAFYVKLVNNKVVDNLLICPVLNFIVIGLMVYELWYEKSAVRNACSLDRFEWLNCLT